MSIKINLDIRNEQTLKNYLTRYAQPVEPLSNIQQDSILLIAQLQAEVRHTEAVRYLKIYSDAIENNENGIEALFTAIVVLLRNYSFSHLHHGSYEAANHDQKIIFASEILRWATS
jgi:hypothetical protein